MKEICLVLFRKVKDMMTIIEIVRWRCEILNVLH